MSALEELLGTEGVSAFRAAYPDQWLHTPGTALPATFTWADLNQVLAAATLPCEWINVVVDGRRVTPADLTDLSDHVRGGHTLVVRHLERVHPRIAAIASTLAGELGEPVAANLYASQPGRQGFRMHYDSHDVLVAHLAGTKSWRVYPRKVPYLVSGAPENERAVPDDASPIAEPTLHPGDVLYLPRGQWHAAVATSESMHLTLGIYPRTGIDLLAFLADHLHADVDLRRPAPVEPVGPTEVMGPRRRAHVADTLATIRSALEDPGLVDAYARHVARTARPHPRSIFPITTEADTFTVAPGVRLHATAGSEIIELTGYGADVSLPAQLSPLVQALTTSAAVDTAALSHAVDEPRDGLSTAIGALRRLGWIEPDTTAG